MNIAKPFCLQGHRGARGLYPENTLIGFIEALRSGLNTLEMDVVISADGKVVVSHEAWMNDIICSLPNGAPLEKGSGKQYNLYQMPYSEIRRFDCGKRGHPRFPMQQAIPAYKPLLSEVMDTLEAYSKEKALGELYYNIELKTASEDTLFNPAPATYVERVCAELAPYHLKKRLYLQSFDVRLLQELKKKDRFLQLGLLVEDGESMAPHLGRLGFLPDAYNPEFEYVNQDLVNDIHRRGMQIFTWTVNDVPTMQTLLAMGVDGIISDYPDRLMTFGDR